MKYNKGLTKKNNRYLKELRRKPTKEELVIRQFLIEKNIKHIFQKGFFLPFHRIVDFYVPNGGWIIEVDGGYHKGQILYKDNIKDTRWREERKMKTIRIKNSDVMSGAFKGELESIFNK